MIKLKPCPFCGKTPVIHLEKFFGEEKYFISCKNEDCFINPITDVYKLKANAIIAWNTRDNKNDDN